MTHIMKYARLIVFGKHAWTSVVINYGAFSFHNFHNSSVQLSDKCTKTVFLIRFFVFVYLVRF